MGVSVLLILGFGGNRSVAPQIDQKRMSFHNRLLLNRAAVSGLRNVQVMLAASHGKVAQVAALVERLGGRVLHSVAAVAYLRVEVPIETVVGLVADPAVDAYQVSSLSKASWLRDGPPQVNATMFRGFETTPVGAAVPSRKLDLPLLTVARSRDSGYTADDDAGMSTWFQTHPTYDGRGVTIALLESGNHELMHPAFRSAKALDGRDVPKLAGIVNTIALDDPDDTRVELNVQVRAARTWCRIGDRTYTMPGPGTYAFGFFTLPAAANLLHRFGVIRDETSGTVLVDTDGDADFQDETPIADINERLDVRSLKLVHPRPADLSFVIARGRAPHVVHVYVARGDHQTMTLSVAAGSKSEDSLAYGVAPGARILLVRNQTAENRLHDMIEGYLEVAARPDVDVLVDASGIDGAPDTGADFVGLLFSRMIAAFGKPIFHSAGNWHQWMNSVSALGSSFSVGGSLGSPTFAALFGGATLDDVTVHHAGAAGPSVDGMLKPDFLAPMHRIAASLWNAERDIRLPRNHPDFQLPPGYRISCCTSASAPYAAGIAALLLSGSKQERIPYTLESLAHALKTGARFLPDVPSWQQGNGLLDINAAWRTLQKRIDIPRIQTRAHIVHPLATYAARGTEGEGIFEFAGWTVGMREQREIQVRRLSGSPGVTTYRLSWTGDDGTFVAPPTIGLPLEVTVPLPVAITARTVGTHSAILNLHDATTGAIVFRAQATIVVSDRVNPRTHTLHLRGSVSLMQKNAHFVYVPADMAAMTIDLEVMRGSVTAAMVPGHSLMPVEYAHVFPQYGRTFTAGRYTVVLPRPTPGTWTLDIGNVSARGEPDRSLVSTDQAEYGITVRLLSAALRVRASSANVLRVDIENLASALREPALETAVGTLRSHQGRVLYSGLPNLFDVDVPAGAHTMALRLHTKGGGSLLELHLYNCTSGECFSHEFTLPAGETQTIVVRQPPAGRWVAAVNAAPFPASAGGFVLEEIIAGAPQRQTPAQKGPRPASARWTEVVPLPSLSRSAASATPIVLCELIDLAVQGDEIDQMWETRALIPHLRQTPAAIGAAVHRR